MANCQTSNFRRVRACGLATVLLFASAGPTVAQWTVGADFVSRYVWRGFDFGEAFSVQPALVYSDGGFEIGAWGSFTVSAAGATKGLGSAANEADAYVGYTVKSESGLSVGVTLRDHYFPGSETDMGFGDADSHNVEAMVTFVGPESFPVDLMVAAMTDGSGTYVEAGFLLAEGDVAVRAHVGGVTGESDFYGLDSGGIVNVGVTGSTSLAVTDSFSLPIFSQVILNPEVDRALMVFGFSLSN